MTRRFFLGVALLVLNSVSLHCHAADSGRDFIDFCRGKIGEDRVIPGENASWFFHAREIRQLSLGPFWNQPWEKVTSNHSNPIPSMVDFHRQLQARNVSLLVVPATAKASIYPEKLASRFAPGDAPSLAPFIDLLRREGLDVLDLESFFINLRKMGDQTSYWCSQDAHVSPLGCVRIADLIAGRLESGHGIARNENPSLRRCSPVDLKIVGDLVAYTEREKTCPPETVKVQFVGDPAHSIEDDANSPVLLLGDSHTLAFSDAGSFHCDGAGLFDHLSSALGYAVDLVGSASGGLVASRINLYRKAISHPGYWERKKAVVWVFTCREFTQSTDSKGFIQVPIDRESRATQTNK